MTPFDPMVGLMSIFDQNIVKTTAFLNILKVMKYENSDKSCTLTTNHNNNIIALHFIDCLIYRPDIVIKSTADVYILSTFIMEKKSVCFTCWLP